MTTGGRPVCIVESGAHPYVNEPGHAPATPVADGPPIVLVESGAAPITLINNDGSPWEPEP